MSLVHHCRQRFWLDILTTLPWDWMVLTATGVAPNTIEGRYIALLSLFKLGRMYRLVVMFYNISYNLSVGLLSLTLMRNFTVCGVTSPLFVSQGLGPRGGLRQPMRCLTD